MGALALVWWRERTPPVFGEAAEILEHEEDRTENPAMSLLLVLLGLASMAVGDGSPWRGRSGSSRPCT